MARLIHSFARPEPRFKPEARVLVICEDSKSCRGYLEDAVTHFRANVEVEISHCGKTDPKGIVEEAIKRLHAFDKVYCAIDRDAHETFGEGLNLAKANADKLEVIVSNPCYEYWLLLHFRKTRKPYRGVGKNSSGDLVVRDLRKENGMGLYNKGATINLFDTLVHKLPDARKHASQVLAEALQDNEMNPSTMLHELIALFERLGTPQLAT